MSSSAKDPQKISRLTPLKDVLAHIASNVALVAPRQIGVAEASGCVLAADALVPEAQPTHAIALRDGFAVNADETTDGSSYAPAPLKIAQAIDAGDPLPAGADAVAAQDTVTAVGSEAQAVTPIAAGDGVLPAHGDAKAGAVLRRAGEKLRGIDLAVLHALGIAHVAVCRPCVQITVARAIDDDILEAIAGMISRLVVASGGEIVAGEVSGDATLGSDDVDLVSLVGGSGTGLRDVSVHLLAQAGKVAFHGIGIAPGETAAMGSINNASVLILPGRLDAAFAAWATLGEAIMAGLTGYTGSSPFFSAMLTRKVTSTIGLAEVVPVLLTDAGALPLASGYTPLQAMMQANAYMMVPADSEGYAAGTTVEVRILP